MYRVQSLDFFTVDGLEANRFFAGLHWVWFETKATDFFGSIRISHMVKVAPSSVKLQVRELKFSENSHLVASPAKKSKDFGAFVAFLTD